MKVVVASGKGGTGKTTVAASLTAVWPRPSIAVDLDVEEPNLHLFLKPEIQGEKKAFIEIPVVDEEKCNYCRACADLCQFKAIVVLGEMLIITPEMCHGCGGCIAVCPEKALTSGKRELGDLVWGTAGSNGFVMGRLRVGEAMSPPLIRAVKTLLSDMPDAANADAIIDAPPGVSCPAVNAVSDADVIVMVTEPTPFGLYDLQLAHDAFKQFGKPLGIVINRSGLGEDAVYHFCRDNNLPIWAEIPFSREIAAAYSNGRITAQLSADLRSLFVNLSDYVISAQAIDRMEKEVLHA